MPAPLSVPDQVTGNDRVVAVPAMVSTDGRAATVLTGRSASRVFVNVGVTIGAFASKTTEAKLGILVPVIWAAASGVTLYVTLPWPITPSVSGGKKPSDGSDGARLVFGSSVVKVHLSRPTALSMLPCARTT